jgi:HEAT repeat protein
MSALTNALHDRDAEVRAAAALSLGAFGEPSESTIAQLEFVATSDEEQVRQAAATALECIRR